MNKLNKLFIITMIIGILLVGCVLYSSYPLVVASTVYFLSIILTIRYALNGGK